MFYGETEDSLQVELSLFEHLIEKNGLGDSIFPLIPEKEKMNKTVDISNYFENKFNALLLLLKNEKAQNRLRDSLSMHPGINVKTKINILMECLNNYRAIINTEKKAISIINLKKLMNHKAIILDNDFFTMDWKQEFEKASYQFYLLFLLETESITKVINKKDDMITTLVQPNDFLDVAVITIRKYLTKFGEENLKFLFEYFFIRFTIMYQYLNLDLYEFRGRLMEGLACEVSGYSYNK